MAPYMVGSIEVKQRSTASSNPPSFVSKTIELPKGHRKDPEARALPISIIFDENQVLTLRDGAKIYADVYRPKTEGKVPAIVMWGPYGKSNCGETAVTDLPMNVGMPVNKISGYQNFEGLDPAEWVPRDYAIVNVDSRGVNASDGDLRFWGTAEGRDGHDAIEEIARLPWCSGKVGMAGNSWLAISQFFIAAERPPHLTCIAPLEGLSDPLREETCRGGIPYTSFVQFVADGLKSGQHEQEDYPAMVQSYSVSNEYFEDKRANMAKIEVPAYIGASYSTHIHTIGSLRAFEEIPHNNKWLVLHATQEWYDIYSDERTEDLNRFFDYYLKGAQNNWSSTAPVRVALLRYNKAPIVDAEFSDLPWHLASTLSKKLHLTPAGNLSIDKPSEAKTLSYQADSSDSSSDVTFAHQFSGKTVLVGPSTVKIQVASPDHDDLDVYAFIFKADQNGNILAHQNLPIPTNYPISEVEKWAESRFWKYQGPSGMLRASRRHVSPELSGKTWKTLSHQRIEKVTPGQVIELEIQLWPTGIVFEEGEQLVLKISGRRAGVFNHPYVAEPSSDNKGKHILHFGNEYESYLQYFTIDI